ncbi:MAG: carbohydrate ABC transporter permease [Bacillota bacterium]
MSQPAGIRRPLLPRRQRQIFGKTGFYVFLAVVLAFTLFPFLWMVLAAFKTNAQITDPSQIFIFKPYWKNFSNVFMRYDFVKPILNSFIVAVMSTLIGLLLGLPASYAIARANKSKTSLVILLVRFFPAIAFMLPWYIIFSRLGITDTHVALILSHLLINVPFIVWVMIPYFESIPRELEEAALLDGCRTFSAFRRIILPLTGPGLITTSLLSAIFSWNNFMFSLILSGGNTKTVPLALLSFVSYASVDWGAMMAAAVVITLPILAISLIAQKYIIAGLTAGAVKG